MVTTNLSDGDGLPNTNTYLYQWEKTQNNVDWILIKGATSSSYSLYDPDVGYYFRGKVSYKDLKNTNEVTYTTTSAVIVGINDTPSGNVTVDGKFAEGKKITDNTTAISDADGLGEFLYQWQRSTDNSNWTDISSAIEKTYALTDTDGNKYVRIKLSYKDLQGTTETLYSSSSQVENVNAEPTGNIVISGTATEGNTLTLNKDNLQDGDGLGTLFYQWQRSFDGTNWDVIEGQYGLTFNWMMLILEHQLEVKYLTSISRIP